MKFEYNADTQTGKFTFTEDISVEIEGDFEVLHGFYHQINRECERRMDARISNLKIDMEDAVGRVFADYTNY